MLIGYRPPLHIGIYFECTRTEDPSLWVIDAVYDSRNTHTDFLHPNLPSPTAGNCLRATARHGNGT